MWDFVDSQKKLIIVGSAFFLLALLLILFSIITISSWTLFSTSLLVIVFAGLACFTVFLQNQEVVAVEDGGSESIISLPEVEEYVEELTEELKEETPPPFAVIEELGAQVEELSGKVEQLEKELENAHQQNASDQEKLEEKRKLNQELSHEKEHYYQQLESMEEEFEQFKESSEEALAEERERTQQALESITTLRTSLDSKQQQNEKLDQKIKDLTYEIKTLLQIADMSATLLNEEPAAGESGNNVNETATHYQTNTEALDQVEEEEEFGLVQTPDEAKGLLKRCIDIAQKITGSHHFSAHKSRFGELALDNYALDLRRLCDNLRSENQSTVFVFSPKENKLLFINNQVRELLGWSPEKFLQDFDYIVQEGMFEWKNSLSHLNSFNQSQTRFVMRTNSGKDLLLHCQLGLIPTGIFRNNVIGVLYPA